MSIVSSTYDLFPPESDGRRYVRERHYDQDGREYTTLYLADPGTDYAARLAATVAVLDAQLADEEIERLTSGA